MIALLGSDLSLRHLYSLISWTMPFGLAGSEELRD